MILDNNRKEEILSASHEVYTSYCAIDFFKNKKIAGPSGQSYNLFAEAQQLITEERGEKQINIGGIQYSLIKTGDKPNYYFELKKSADVLPYSPIKRPNNYTIAETLELLTTKKFEINTIEDQAFLSTTLSNGLRIGGKGKIDLYRSHLDTLYNIIKKINLKVISVIC